MAWEILLVSVRVQRVVHMFVTEVWLEQGLNRTKQLGLKPRPDGRRRERLRDQEDHL